MVDAVTSQTLLDNKTRLIMKFTNISDGTGESAVTKVTASTFSCEELYIERVHFMTHGMGADILFDATTPVLAMTAPVNATMSYDFSSFGGIKNNADTGKTGNIKVTTYDFTAGDRYTIILEMRKVGSY